MRGFLTQLLCAVLALAPVISSEEIPIQVQEVFSNKCLDCHDADSEKGDINLDLAVVDWQSEENYQLFHRALKAVEQGIMPPVDKPRLTISENQRPWWIGWTSLSSPIPKSEVNIHVD